MLHSLRGADFSTRAGNRITVPAPSTTIGARWLYDFLAGEVGALSAVGFSAVQLPPVSKAQGGAGDGCDGYGVFDRRDIGSKDQQGSRPTRYGDADSLRRCIANAHAVGLDVYHDVVLHQLIGQNGGPGVFRYLGADERPNIGRGAMNPGCFRRIPPANRPEDAVPVPFFDFAFGDELVYQNCDPPGYTIEDALDYGDWLFRTTDADGGRLDDVKGTYAPFVSQFMRSRAMADKFLYSEYFDGDPAAFNWWATTSPMLSRSLVADFTLHFALQAACNGGNASALNCVGYMTWNPYMACTFVDNPDTDTSFGEQVVSSKLLAYAYMLTAEGYPFVYGKDYFTGDVWPGAYGLKPWIDNLIWIHETLASGPTVNRWVDGVVIVQNRTGWPGLLTALNFDTWNVREITCDTALGPTRSCMTTPAVIPTSGPTARGERRFAFPATPFKAASPISVSRAPDLARQSVAFRVGRPRLSSAPPTWIRLRLPPEDPLKQGASGVAAGPPLAVIWSQLRATECTRET